jgi:cyanate permease
MEPQAQYTYLVAAGLALGAIYSAIVAYEAYPKGWKVAASALAALALGALAYYLIAGI